MGLPREVIILHAGFKEKRGLLSKPGEHTHGELLRRPRVVP